MKISDYKHAYFLGIGGIGMSAIARYFNSLGMVVAGYDKTPSPLTAELSNEGMEITYEDQLLTLPSFVRTHPDETLFVYTPAIPKDHVQWNFLKNLGIPLKKRAEVLGLISQDTYCIAVAGTHGKTTTSSLVAHLLDSCHINFSCFLGGISANLGSNYVKRIGRTEWLDQPIVVVEADEFDRSFLHLSPQAAIITSCDPDHLDIYGNADAFIDGFNQFINKIQPLGKLYRKANLPLKSHPSQIEYGINEGETAGTQLSFVNGISSFHLVHRGIISENWIAGVPGKHNIENATAALALCLDLGLPEESLRKGLESFTGVKRRFEYIVKHEHNIVIDDYAHHPGELDAFITAVRDMYPSHSITGIFQPHLYSRTRDFAPGFAKSLSALDELILMDIYPARELPIEGITSQWLLEQIPLNNKSLLNTEEILQKLSLHKPPILLILGAGDIDRLVPKIKALYGN